MTVPSLKAISRLLATIIFSIFLSFSPARGEAVTSVLGAQAANFTCGEIKDMAQKVPERLFKMWANSGTIETHSAAAVQIIQAGNVQWLLENIGDVTLGIQILEEAAFGTVENSLKILSKALVTKSFTAVMDIVGKGGAYGPASAIIFTCETLYAFGDYLSAESLDKNLKAFAKLSEKNPAMLDINYFQKTYLGWDGKNWSDEINKKQGWREMYARRNSVVEYANRKLLNPNFPQLSEWHNNVNVVRTTIHLIIKDVKDILEKERKYKQLQEELKTKLAALKQQHAALTTFQAIRKQLQAMTCQDTASQDCIDMYNLSLSMLGDLTLDAGDIKGLAPGILDGLKASSNSLDGQLDAIGPKLENEYKTKVAEYCKSAKAGMDSLQKTISLAKASNPEIAARAIQAKGYRDTACAATVVSKAKAAADSAKNAATEAHLLSNLIPLLSSDLDNLSPPAAMDISDLEAQLASMEKALTAYETSVSENFKKWEKFRSSVNNVRNQLSKVRSACGKGVIFKGVAIDLLIGRIEGKLKSIESTVPDVRAENNALGTLSRALKQNSTYLAKLKGNHETYRECLKKVPDTKALVVEAKKLLQEAKDNVGKAEGYAASAEDCYNKLKNKPECKTEDDCPDDQTCKDGKCVDKLTSECITEDDCPEDKTCKDGKCVDKLTSECITEDDCPDDQTCKDGKCVKKEPDDRGGYFISGPSVVTAGDGVTFTAVEKNGTPHTGGTFSWFASDSSIMSLGRSGVSVSGAAFKPGTCTIVLSGTGSPGGLAVTHTLTINPQCTTDANCPAGKICQGGLCVDPPDPLCTTDADCPVDYVCKDGDCVYQPKPKCKGDNDCPRGYVCKDGDCVYQKPTGCQSNGDCPKGYVCEQGTGKCRSPFDDSYSSFTTAQTDRDDQRSQNLADQSANDQNTGQSGFFSDDMTQDLANNQDQISKDCYSDSDCNSGFHCENGICVEIPGCRGDSDCPSDQICQNGSCVAKPQPAAQPSQPNPDQQIPAKPDTLAVSPANKVITKTDSVSLKAILTKGVDGTTQDVTGQTSWTPSSNFSSSQIGSHRVTATYNSLSAVSTITVVEEKGLGDITVSEKTITVTFWDHGQEDGDMIDININGKAVFSGITLTNAPQSRTVTLKAGALVFGFTALNEGRISPNTATVKFSSVTSGKAEQKYTLKKNSEANMNITYIPQ